MKRIRKIVGQVMNCQENGKYLVFFFLLSAFHFFYCRDVVVDFITALTEFYR